MYVHESVMKALKNFDKNLTIIEPKNLEDSSPRLYIAQIIPWVDTVDDDLCLGKARDSTYGILPIYQASEFDDRWFYILHEQRGLSSMSTREMRQQQIDERVAKVRTITEDWAKEVGYWHFKRKFSNLNLSSYKAENPYQEIKDLREKLGRNLKY